MIETPLHINFPTQYGSSSCTADIVDSYENRKRWMEDEGKRIDAGFLNEFSEALWNALLNELEESLKQFLYEPANERTFSMIEATMKRIIDADKAAYPFMESYAFQKWLKEKRKEVIDSLLEVLDSYPDADHCMFCHGWVFMIEESNSLVINKNKILNYILLGY